MKHLFTTLLCFLFLGILLGKAQVTYSLSTGYSFTIDMDKFNFNEGTIPSSIMLASEVRVNFLALGDLMSVSATARPGVVPFISSSDVRQVGLSYTLPLTVDFNIGAQNRPFAYQGLGAFVGAGLGFVGMANQFANDISDRLSSRGWAVTTGLRTNDSSIEVVYIRGLNQGGNSALTLYYTRPLPIFY